MGFVLEKEIVTDSNISNAWTTGFGTGKPWQNVFLYDGSKYYHGSFDMGSYCYSMPYVVEGMPENVIGAGKTVKVISCGDLTPYRSQYGYVEYDNLLYPAIKAFVDSLVATPLDTNGYLALILAESKKHTDILIAIKDKNISVDNSGIVKVLDGILEEVNNIKSLVS